MYLIIRRYHTAHNSTTSSVVTVVNRAVAGTSSHWAFQQMNYLLEPLPNKNHVDLVIYDYDVNDCHIAFNDKNSLEMNVMEASTLAEAVIRSILLHDVKPAMLYLNIATTHER
jgi:hypothetical protein